jgi:hypothetical protein
MAGYEIFFKESVWNDLKGIPKKDLKWILARIMAKINEPLFEFFKIDGGHFLWPWFLNRITSTADPPLPALVTGCTEARCGRQGCRRHCISGFYGFYVLYHLLNPLIFFRAIFLGSDMKVGGQSLHSLILPPVDQRPADRHLPADLTDTLLLRPDGQYGGYLLLRIERPSGSFAFHGCVPSRHRKPVPGCRPLIAVPCSKRMGTYAHIG